MKYYGDAGAERGVDILPYDGGYVLFGTTSSSLLLQDEEGSAGDLYLVFTSSRGNELRSYAYGYSTDDQRAVHDEAVDLFHTEAGDFLLLGTASYEVSLVDGSSNTQRDVLLVSVDAAGKQLATRVYGEQIFVSSNQGIDVERVVDERAAGVVEVSDGYVLLSTTSLVSPQKPQPYDPLLDRSDLALTKIDKDTFEVLWSRKYGYNGEDVAVSLVRGEGDNVLILAQTDRLAESVSVGDKSLGGGGKNVLVVEVDASGSEARVRVFGGPQDEHPTRLRKLEDNQYVVVGSYGEGSLMRSFYYQLSGITLSEFSYDLGGLPNRITDVAASYQPLSYWMVGYVRDYAQAGVSRGNEMLLSLVERRPSSGQESVRAEFLYGGNESDVFSRILHLNDEGLILFGTVGFEGGSTMMCLMKTNKYGTYEVE